MLDLWVKCRLKYLKDTIDVFLAYLETINFTYLGGKPRLSSTNKRPPFLLLR